MCVTLCVCVATALGGTVQALTHTVLLIKDEQALSFHFIPNPPFGSAGQSNNFPRRALYGY